MQKIMDAVKAEGEEGLTVSRKVRGRPAVPVAISPDLG